MAAMEERMIVSGGDEVRVFAPPKREPQEQIRLEGAGALCVWLAALYGKSELGGMSGDVSGFALTLGELAGILCLCAF